MATIIIFRQRLLVSAFVIMVLMLAWPRMLYAENAEDTAISGVIARLSQLHNFIVSYTRSNITGLSDLRAAKLGLPQATTTPSVDETEERFCIFNRYARLDIQRKDLARAQRNSESLKSVTIVTPERMEMYDQLRANSAGSGGITSQRRFNWEIDSCLGMREPFAFNWFSADDLKSMQLHMLGKGELSLSIPIKNGRKEWVYNENLGFAMTKYEVVSDIDHIVSFEISDEDFRPVQNLILPFKIDVKMGIVINGKLMPTSQQTYVIHDYKINPDENNLSLYDMQWPAGAIIMNEATGIIVHNGAQTRPLSDQDIADADVANKAAHQAQLQHTQDRIDKILGTTKPSTKPSN